MRKMTFRGRRATRRKRGTARLFVLGAAVAATGAASARPVSAQAPVPEGPLQAKAQVAQRFDIPAGQLQVVAVAFTRTTGLPVVFSNPDLGLIESPGVSGNMTREAALAALLQGTSVRGTFSGQGVTLDIGGVAEVVDVRAAPAAVASPKYLVPLRDVAQSVAVIPRKVIDEQAAFTLSDALRNVPGITLQAGEGGGASNTAGDMFNLRGFNASNSLFVDGVRDDGLIARDIFNLEQVEVFPPVYNQDDGQLVKGVTFGALGRITDRWEILANFGYLDTEQQSQNPLTNGLPMILTPEFSSSIWSTYQLPGNITIGGGVRHTSDVFVNTANTIVSPGYAIVDALASTRSIRT